MELETRKDPEGRLIDLDNLRIEVFARKFSKQAHNQCVCRWHKPERQTICVAVFVERVACTRDSS